MANINSKEFQLLIEIIRQDVSGLPVNYSLEGIRWNEFLRLISYHGMRHMVFANKQILDLLPAEIKKTLENFSFIRTVAKLNNQQEIKNLFNLFELQDLHPLLIKGTIFPFYTENVQLKRESADIDLVIPKNEITKVALLLIKNGYCIRNAGKLNQIKDLEKELGLFTQNSFFQEIHFEKKPFNVDLHWKLFDSYLPFTFPLEQLYDNTLIIDYYGQKMKSISIENFFWTLLIHHGGKEYWLKMKNLVDLMMFLKVHQNQMNWDEILKKAEKFHLVTPLKNGIWFIKYYFNFPINKELENIIENHKPKIVKCTLDFWIKGKNWNNAIPRFQFEWILKQSQDSSFRWWKYAYQFYLAYKTPNPFEWNRILNIPNGFGIFNFLDKFVSWVFRRYL